VTLKGETPARIGKYEVVSRLGAGGMAEVFLARLPGIAGFSKTVVVKRLRPDLAKDQRFVQLFVEEAKLAAQVQHKNVVQIFELGSEGPEATVFMAMEYVMGVDLKSLLVHAGRTGERIPPWLSVHAVCEVLEALAFAHGLDDDLGRPRQIVHSDVSPENIFLARHGEVKLGDFGVARDATRPADPFLERLKGKVAYMAPELVSGGAPSHATDVYAAAVVLWECLAQRRIFKGDDPDALMAKVQRGVDTPPSRYRQDVSPELDLVLMQALSVDPGDRPASARELQVLLRNEVARLQPRLDLDRVRRELDVLMASGEVVPEPGLPTDPDPMALVPLPSRSSDFEVLLSDVISDLSARSVTPLDLPAELASLQLAPWPGVPRAPDTENLDEDPDPTEEHPLHEDPETTAVVRARTRPRSRPPIVVDPQPPAAPKGPRPVVWVRSRGAVQIGPRDPMEALAVLEELGSDDARSALEISTDQKRWLSVLALPGLLGEGHLKADPTLPAGGLAGSFQTRSPTTLLAEVARAGTRGRLVFVRYETVNAERVELGVDMGHLVAYGASRVFLPGWARFLAEPARVPAEVVHALAEVVSRKTPLEGLVSPAAQAVLQQERGQALRRGLVGLHGWPWGRFGFEAGAEVAGGRVTPVPIFALLKEILQEAKPVPVMMAHLTGVMDVPMIRSPAFEREARALGLSLEDRARLERFGGERTLRDSFQEATSLRDELPLVRLGYLLREIGLLIPRDPPPALD
jgi:serine/threonine protein kinase